MICQSTIRRFDGDESSTLHTAIFTRGATALRFVSWATIDKGTSRYAANNRAPAITIAWVPREQISEESSTAAELDAALANPDQVPLVRVRRRRRAVAYVTDNGAAFPTVGVKGTAMALAVRVENIFAGTRGALTFGWV